MDEGGPDHTDVLDLLLQIQRADTGADQLRVARQRLPERAQHAEATRSRSELAAAQRAAAARMTELEAELSRAEAEGDSLAAHSRRLEAQLRTVIAPREAEALQREIAGLAQQRSDLDDRGLELLDELGALESAAGELAGREPDVTAEVSVAEVQLAAAESKIDAELAELTDRRGVLAGELPAAVVVRYERARSLHDGVAISRLDGSRCGGCHIDLSRSELEEVRHLPAGEVGECPNCGRMLVS